MIFEATDWREYVCNMLVYRKDHTAPHMVWQVSF